MSIEEAAKRVRELDTEAVKAPWRVVDGDYFEGVTGASSPNPGANPDLFIGRNPGGHSHAKMTRADAALIAEYRTLAPQLAAWVEKALPVIRAAESIVAYTEATASPRRINECYEALRDAVGVLDSPSSLAAEGMTD